MSKPTTKPKCPNFGSGPCAKRPGYNVTEALKDTPLGRSHRSDVGKERIGRSISETKRILGIPDNYRVGIVTGSDTCAFEMAMWSLLGPRSVDVLAWESFSKGWVTDVTKQLPLHESKGGKGVKEFSAEYGQIPDLSLVTQSHDIIFVLNGTTSGVAIPNFDWISADREGLTLCDATSGLFAQPVEWSKVDVLTFSWQKVLGGEAGHGMIVLSPRAVERLETYTPPWPLPKLFRMTKNGKIDEALFKNSPINTPSMICIEDYLDALRWVDSLGGVSKIRDISNNNYQVLENFVSEHSWISFLAKSPEVRSHTSVCLSISDCTDKQIQSMCQLIAAEGAGFDIASYPDAPAGLRIWCGATVDAEDIKVLLQWIDWAHTKVLSQ